MKIKMDRQYRTVCGKSVRILCTDRANPDYPVVALIENQEILPYTIDGKAVTSCSDRIRYDLVEVTPYDEWKIDDKIQVRNSMEETWVNRHFNGISPDGLVMAFPNGQTSFTTRNGDESVEWNYARKFEESK